MIDVYMLTTGVLLCTLHYVLCTLVAIYHINWCTRKPTSSFYHTIW